MSCQCLLRETGDVGKILVGKIEISRKWRRPHISYQLHVHLRCVKYARDCLFNVALQKLECSYLYTRCLNVQKLIQYFHPNCWFVSLFRSLSFCVHVCDVLSVYLFLHFTESYPRDRHLPDSRTWL